MSLEVRPVVGKRDLERFVRLPFELYRNEPRWVAPLLTDVRKRLDRKANPFFRHAEAEYFLAWRDGRPVGRISAQVDRNFNEHQQNDWGLWGFFESEDDPETCEGLLAAADGWLLIEGHDRPAIILATWQHPYYQGLLESAGLVKAMDLLMWSLHISDRAKVHPAIWEAAGKVESEHGIVCRPMRKRDLDAEVTAFLEVYNAAWEKNWGAVPLTAEEAHHYAEDLRPVLDENWAMIAERKDTGEVVGAALTLPDFNQVLSHLNGRLFPLGWAKALYWRRKIDSVRVFALGVKPEYQHTGVAARFYQMHFESAVRTPQKQGEMGWILEVNTPMNRAMEGMGGEIVRRFRIYERVFAE
jgi:GNAT superfamily N-acetyltransferase